MYAAAESRAESDRVDDRADAIARLAGLLDAERAAALAADVDQLLAIQAEKQRAMSSVLGTHGGTFPQSADRLADTARENLLLLRHLVSCLRSLVGEEEPMYSNAGRRSPTVAPKRRGAL